MQANEDNHKGKNVASGEKIWKYLFLSTVSIMVLGFVLTFLFRKKGNIEILTEPSGATVYDSGGTELGTTPFNENKAEAGLYQYTLKLENYKTESLKIEVKDPNEKQSKNVILKQIGNFELVTEPVGATVSGSIKGTTPLKQNLKPGTYEIKVSKPGFETQSLSIRVNREGEQIKKVIKLIPGGDNQSEREDIPNGKEECESSGKVWTGSTCREKESPPANVDSGDWSGYLGIMNLDDADAKCKSRGMRLPTINELKSAHNSGVTKNWQSDGLYYWSYPPDIDGKNYSFGVHYGDTNSSDRSTNNSVRCHK